MIPSGLDDLEGKGVGAVGRKIERDDLDDLDDWDGKGKGAAESRVFCYDNAFGREKAVVFE